MSPSCVQLLLTSTPYPDKREAFYLSVREPDFPDFTLEWFEAARHLLTPSGGIAMVIGNYVRRRRFSTFVERTIVELEQRGWFLGYRAIWYKPDTPPMGSNRLPRSSWEHILVFTPDPEKFYIDPFANGKEDGRRGPINGRAYRDVFAGQGMGPGEVSRGPTRGTNVYEVPVSAKRELEVPSKVHVARFPIRLAEKIILTLTRPGDLVLDCFGGSGSTSCAALRTGRRSIMCEILPEYAEIARQRLDLARAAYTRGGLSQKRRVETAGRSQGEGPSTTEKIGGKPLLPSRTRETARFRAGRRPSRRVCRGTSIRPMLPTTKGMIRR